ncbi:putative monooxygenase p33MONOX [Pelmatolapia mariae]|uniref:putative monooxygenase p33MONOX n=1 Tax=Pelmatolapia mariae TaxID=158779 RepID=UPI002FE53E67
MDKVKETVGPRHQRKDIIKKKLRMPSGTFKDDRLTTSASSTPGSTPSITPNVTPPPPLQDCSLQKSSTMDGTNTQVNLKVDDPAKLIPPKIEISDTEAKWQTSWPHKLKPWDINVLTPSGF